MADTNKGVAVDAGGNTYMIDATTPHVEKYDDEGVSLLTFTTNVPATPTGIAVGPTGKIYVIAGSKLDIFDDEGIRLGAEITADVPAAATGIIVDERGFIYIVEDTAITKFDDQGIKLLKFNT